MQHHRAGESLHELSGFKCGQDQPCPGKLDGMSESLLGRILIQSQRVDIRRSSTQLARTSSSPADMSPAPGSAPVGPAQ